MLSPDVPGNASPMSHHSLLPPSISTLPGETDIDCDNDHYEIESDNDGNKQESTDNDDADNNIKRLSSDGDKQESTVDDDNKIESDSDMMNKQETIDCDEDEDTEDESEKMLQFIENEMNFSKLPATAPVNMSGTANVDSARAPRDLSSMDFNALRDFVRDVVYNVLAYKHKLRGHPVADDDESRIRRLKRVATDVEVMLFLWVDEKPEEYRNLKTLSSRLYDLMYPERPVLKTSSHGNKQKN